MRREHGWRSGGEARGVLLMLVATSACGASSPERPRATTSRVEALCVAAASFERKGDDLDHGAVHAADDVSADDLRDCAALGICRERPGVPRLLTELRNATALARRLDALFGPPTPIGERRHGARYGGEQQDAPLHYVLHHLRTNIVLTVYVDPKEGPAYGGSGTYDAGTGELGREPSTAEYLDAAREFDAVLAAAASSTARCRAPRKG